MTTDNKPDQGQLWLSYTDRAGRLHRLHMGYVSKISMSYNKSTSIVPIVTKHADEAFPLDGGTTKSYSFNGYRMQPSTISDMGNTVSTGESDSVVLARQSAWSCKKWAKHVSEFIDRWQMKSDGCDITFVPASTNIYSSIGTSNVIHGYIKTMEYTYNSEYDELLSYYMTFDIGTAYVRIDDQTERPPCYDRLQSVALNRSYVMFSSSDLNDWFLIGSLDEDKRGAISSYKIIGGPSEPIERIDMSVSYMKLTAVAPALASYLYSGAIAPNGIQSGRNSITISAIGKGTYIVDQVTTSGSVRGRNKTLRIKGYCLAQSYKKTGLGGESISGTPFDIINTILSSGTYGPRFVSNGFVTNVRCAYRDGPDDVLTFYKSSKRTLWQILQICAVLLNCKLFFSSDRAYLVDYT